MKDIIKKILGNAKATYGEKYSYFSIGLYKEEVWLFGHIEVEAEPDTVEYLEPIK